MTTTAPNGTAQTTQYRYDGNGNLIEVTEPNIGTTTLTYDGVNRLAERTLPNDIRTVYTYKENTDFIESITHYAADGTTVLSSVEYVRNPGGEPSRIIREDGSYVDLQYDDSLRLEKETYYDSNGNLTDETTYTYDAAGNRQSASNGEAQGTYTYDNTHQLAGIDTHSGTETYTYDEGGRVEQVVRDGETLNLFYNSNDLIVKVTDASNNTVVEYGYDSNGRRVEMSDSTGEKNYLVAPNLGVGLDSPHLVSDAAGNPLASYVYAGEMPLMRLDANGNPTYYLEDGMGSVIGLTDGAGAAVETFKYDAFGNLREGGATIADELGGDFRFQGQWLESNTDFYHFRARYYDPETGRFISRDPVDLIETEPESSNPYQFVYNNPLIYSDPTGEFTITELNATDAMGNILQSIRTHYTREAIDFVKNKAGEAFTNLALDYIKSFLPGGLESTYFNLNQEKAGIGISLEDKIQDNICKILRSMGSGIVDRLWIEPSVSYQNGQATGNGYNCGPTSSDKGKGSTPDFIFKQGEPKNNKLKNPASYLIGDIKFTLKKAVTSEILGKGGSGTNQWVAISKYAANYQFSRLAVYLTFRSTIKKYPWSATEKTSDIAKAQKRAFKKGVVLLLITLFD